MHMPFVHLEINFKHDFLYLKLFYEHFLVVVKLFLFVRPSVYLSIRLSLPRQLSAVTNNQQQLSASNGDKYD